MTEDSAPSRKWADLGVRTLSALVLAPLVIAAIWKGGVWFQLFACFLGVLMAHEWTSIAHGRSTSQFALHALAALSAALLPPQLGLGTTLATIFVIAAVAFGGVIWGGRAKSWWNYLGVLYVSFPVLALVTLREDPKWGFHSIIWLVAIVWAADIMAYFVGRIVGGPKLAPSISPKKTWAGLGGAILGSAAAAAAYDAAFISTGWMLIVIAGGLAIVEQAGDMMESAFKRHYGVKDSGHLIPGHGGIIDRVDGLVAVVVVATLIGFMRDSGSAAQGLLAW